MRLTNCYNFHDFRRMAKQRLPGPIFNYIDGAADDEVTYRRNTAAFEHCDLVPNVLRGVGDVDMSVTIMGQKLAMPVYLLADGAPAPLPPSGRTCGGSGVGKIRHDVWRFLARHGQFGRSPPDQQRTAVLSILLPQGSWTEPRNDGARQASEHCRVMMLTVDSITGGNRERDKRTGFAIPFRLNLAGITQFAIKPSWALNYFRNDPFTLPQLDSHIDMGGGVMSISRYFTGNARCIHVLGRRRRDGAGTGTGSSVGKASCPSRMRERAGRDRLHRDPCSPITAADNSDGSRTAFDQLAEVVDAVGRSDRRHDGWRACAAPMFSRRSLGARRSDWAAIPSFRSRPPGRPASNAPWRLMRIEIVSTT